jgi:hypothetical protein
MVYILYEYKKKNIASEDKNIMASEPFGSFIFICIVTKIDF